MNTPTRIIVATALLGPDHAPSNPCEIVIEGERIAAIRPANAAPGRRTMAIPALADAHNHARPLSTTSFGCGGAPLELWLPHLAVMPAVDAYTAAAASFARSLAGGATSVMVHLTRPMGQTPLPEEAREIARAARDVGVSIGLAVSMRDRNPLAYDDQATLLDGLDPATRDLVRATWLRPMPPPHAQLALVDAVADAVSDLPGHVDVQYGPTGVQWCSEALLASVAEASARTGRRVHMHLLETEPQRAWADAAHSGGIVAYLDAIGLLSPRLTLAHCVWARPEELDRIAEAGARIAVSVSSNLHLASGTAPLCAMADAGVPLALGLDGCALDEDDDGLRELRLFHLLGQAPGFRAGGVTRAAALRAACMTGRAGLGLDNGGVIAPGMPADILVLDLDALDRDGLTEVDPRDYLFARAARAHVIDAYSRGRHVLADGEVTSVDVGDLHRRLRDAYRAALPGCAAVVEAWPRVEAALASHYRGCC